MKLSILTIRITLRNETLSIMTVNRMTLNIMAMNIRITIRN
jgi:hypothetical protein